MCTLSMVMDHYNDKFSQYYWHSINIPGTQTALTNVPPPPVDATEALVIGLEKLIADFKKAKEAAILVDKLTAQPDCEDPEKMKLEERVAALEKYLKQMHHEEDRKGIQRVKERYLKKVKADRK